MPKQHSTTSGLGKAKGGGSRSGLGKRVMMKQRKSGALEKMRQTLDYPLNKEDVKRLQRRAGVVRFSWQDQNYEILTDVFRTKATALLVRANHVRMLRGPKSMLTKDDLIFALRAGQGLTVLNSKSAKKRRSTAPKDD